MIDINILKTNMLFVGNLMIVSNIINYYLLGNALFDSNWLLTSIGVLIAYIIFSFI